MIFSKIVKSPFKPDASLIRQIGATANCSLELAKL